MKSKKYSAIQILRFVAASFVVIDHALSDVIRDTGPLVKTSWALGEVGVIVFFGISGFIMASTQFDSFGSPAKALDFWFRRIIRIVPIYTVATTLQYFNKLQLGGVYSFANYLRSIAFIPYIGEGGHYRPILAQGWTLDYEMFFYLIFALSLLFARGWGFGLSIGVFLLLAALHGTAVVTNATVNFYTGHILIYFVSGMLVALAKHYVDRSSHRLWLPTLSVVAIMGIMTAARTVSYGYPWDWYFLALSFVLVFVCVYVCASCLPAHFNKMQSLFERLGDVSYSTYLFHGFTLGALKILSSRIDQHETTLMLAFVLLSVIVGNLTGLIAYMAIERPLTDFFSRRYRESWGKLSVNLARGG
jgi:exopolysaccharide production protein ExoZ